MKYPTAEQVEQARQKHTLTCESCGRENSAAHVEYEMFEWNKAATIIAATLRQWREGSVGQ